MARSAELGAPLEDDEVAKVAALRELEPLRLSTVARSATPEPPHQVKKGPRATKKAQGILYGKKHRDKVLDRLGVGQWPGSARPCGRLPTMRAAQTPRSSRSSRTSRRPTACSVRRALVRAAWLTRTEQACTTARERRPER